MPICNVWKMKPFSHIEFWNALPFCCNSHTSDYHSSWLTDFFMGGNWQRLACVLCATFLTVMPKSLDSLNALYALARKHWTRCLASVCVEASCDFGLICFLNFCAENGITPVLQFLQNMWSLLRWKSPAVTVFAMTVSYSGLWFSSKVLSYFKSELSDKNNFNVG